MSDKSTIEWTDATWNPVTGCDRVSPGCAHCYALELAPRLREMARARGHGKWMGVRDGGRTSGPAFGVTLHPEVLDQPLRWRRPRMVFVNSMSDLFHEEIPREYIASVFGRMAEAHWHTFQVLTKRPERMAELMHDPEFWRLMRLASGETGHELPLPNVWLGVSIENRRFVGRADVLRSVPAAVRFISAEPLLGPLLHDTDIGMYNDCSCGGECDHHKRLGDPYTTCWSDAYEGPELDLTAIDWLIVGGESGPRHRPIKAEWVRALKLAAESEGTRFFFKQWGGRTPKAAGRELYGRTWDEMPECAVVRA